MKESIFPRIQLWHFNLREKSLVYLICCRQIFAESQQTILKYFDLSWKFCHILELWGRTDDQIWQKVWRKSSLIRMFFWDSPFITNLHLNLVWYYVTRNYLLVEKVGSVPSTYCYHNLLRANNDKPCQ